MDMCMYWKHGSCLYTCMHVLLEVNQGNNDISLKLRINMLCLIKTLVQGCLHMHVHTWNWCILARTSWRACSHILIETGSWIKVCIWLEYAFELNKDMLMNIFVAYTWYMFAFLNMHINFQKVWCACILVLETCQDLELFICFDLM